MKKLKTITTIFLIIFCLDAFGGTIRHDVPDDKYVKYGEKHECVFKLGGIIEENGQEVKYFGSCVLVSSRWVVTAAHVVKGAKRTYVFSKDGEIPIEEVIICPDYNGKFGSTDLAVCKIKKGIELNLYPELYEKKDEIGKICGIAGYGRTGTGLTGANKEGDGKRAGSNKIEAVSEGALFCVMDRKNPTELEFLISHGDSGGGLFIDGKLAGINSSVLSNDGKSDSNYGEESCHTRISNYRDWVQKTISQ
jgi:hypothetical protein